MSSLARTTTTSVVDEDQTQTDKERRDSRWLRRYKRKIKGKVSCWYRQTLDCDVANKMPQTTTASVVVKEVKTNRQRNKVKRVGYAHTRVCLMFITKNMQSVRLV